MKASVEGVQGQASSTCAFKHSSVDLHCSAKHPTSSMKWFTVDQNGPKYDWTEISSNEKYNISEENHSTLTIQALKESDERFYCCSETADEPENCWKRAIQLHVSGTVDGSNYYFNTYFGMKSNFQHKTFLKISAYVPFSIRLF